MGLSRDINNIEINRRYKRRQQAIKFNDTIFYPINDIVSGYTIYYVHESYFCMIPYGLDLDFKQVNLPDTQTYCTQHNAVMYKNLLEHRKDPNNDPYRLRDFNSYYLIDGLIVLKEGIERVIENLIF